ncbi:CAP domain-containing protein [Dendryphion nanum]|uniref:CAP domain-containing protein n=1 Tax=Dendryphion nanum TaxID=256645 RepID=A0A9P9E6T1_9PLEO|nr:CAP domain-containing protein [Dendryphion nanum]
MFVRNPATQFSLSFSLLLALLLTTIPTITTTTAFVSATPTTVVVRRDEQQESSKEYTDDSVFRSTALNITNTYRRQHNASALVWNDTLAEFAKGVSSGCVFEHSGGPHGENLASGYPNTSASIIAWGQERKDYDFKKGDFNKATGHFTQLVWKSTTSLGCSRTLCNGRKKSNAAKGDAAPGWYLVCEYSPPGNVLGAFAQNVQVQVPVEKRPEGEREGDPRVPEKEECPQGAHKCTLVTSSDKLPLNQ